MADRELTMDDYLAMLRRRLKVILIPALVAPVAGFLVSYELPPRYTTQSTVLVQGQQVPSQYVAPVVTQDFAQRVNELSQVVLAPNSLRPMLKSLGYEDPQQQNKLINEIPGNLQVTPLITSMSAAAAGSPASRKPSASNEPVPGIVVSYTDKDAERAQKICNAVTSALVTENLNSRRGIATSTSDFLDRQVTEAKRTVDQQNAALADFKRKYMGQLPTDVDNNMRMLMSLNSQLDASTQTLSRAQQDKAYTESMLAQQLAAWKSSMSSSNPQTLQQQLTQLQGQLLQLQARYTDDYPDVIKTKADIAEVEKKLKETNAAAAAASEKPSDNANNSSEPPEIRQLRLQIHQYQSVIEQTTLDQKKLQSAISVYQSRTAMSPAIEDEYKKLTLDNDNAQTFYKDLLAKKNLAAVGTSMEDQQKGEQMTIAVYAALADAPSFPNRPVLAAGGFGVGLALGALIAIFLEFSDKSIRTEKDASAIMDLPLLISVPWLGDEEDEAAAKGNGNGRRRFWGRDKAAPAKDDKEHVEV